MSNPLTKINNIILTPPGSCPTYPGFQPASYFQQSQLDTESVTGEAIRRVRDQTAEDGESGQGGASQDVNQEETGSEEVDVTRVWSTDCFVVSLPPYQSYYAAVIRYINYYECAPFFSVSKVKKKY